MNGCPPAYLDAVQRHRVQDDTAAGALVAGLARDVLRQIGVDVLGALVALALDERRQIRRVVVREVARALPGLVKALEALGAPPAVVCCA